MIGQKHYYEVLQKFAHLFELHFMEERTAYCRLDERGDIEEVIRVVELPGKGEEFGSIVITFNRAILEEYLVLTDSVVVRTFDFTRFRPGRFFNGWTGTTKEVKSDGDLHFHLHIEPGHASYLRGIQLIHPSIQREEIVLRHDPLAEKKREYGSFITHDWRHNEIREISTAPEATTNYFTNLDLPYEISPAFFRSEVLLKYKADPEKYQFVWRSISCRGAWSIKSYDINPEGQVHAYIVDLRRLPYEEQLHWKSHNEKPKGTISPRSYTTDFQGKPYSEYDPMNSLKEAVEKLHKDRIPWWTLRSHKIREQLQYCQTTSSDEWGKEILHLDQLIVEGFETKWLRKKAESLNRTVESNFGSLRLVEECLEGIGNLQMDAKAVVAPLRQVHDLRSKIIGHANDREATAIKKRTIRDHGSYKEHFRDICQQCDESLRFITAAFTKAGF